MGATLNTIPEIEERRPMVAETSAQAVAAREKAAVEARFMVAIGRPRNVDTFRIRLVNACERPRFAESVLYSKPVGGKKVTGPSIRFVEEAIRHFGNLDIQTPVVFDDPERRIIRVSATDLETNASYSTDVAIDKTVERSRVKQGDRVVRSRQNSQGETTYIIVADEDAFLVKQNAHVSKAIRTVGLRVLPSDVVEEAVEVAQDTLKKRDKQDPTAARKRIADSFYGAGIMPNQLEELLGHPLESVNEAELSLLRTIFTALRDGETTWPEVQETFGQKSKEAAKEARTPKAGTAGLKEHLGVTKSDTKEDLTGKPPAIAKGEDDDLALDQQLAKGDAPA